MKIGKISLWSWIQGSAGSAGSWAFFSKFRFGKVQNWIGRERGIIKAISYNRNNWCIFLILVRIWNQRKRWLGSWHMSEFISRSWITRNKNNPWFLMFWGVLYRKITHFGGCAVIHISAILAYSGHFWAAVITVHSLRCLANTPTTRNLCLAQGVTASSLLLHCCCYRYGRSKVPILVLVP